MLNDFAFHVKRFFLIIKDIGAIIFSNKTVNDRFRPRLKNNIIKNFSKVGQSLFLTVPIRAESSKFD
jgi:hypothetical protein